jgi:hypothetical protein
MEENQPSARALYERLNPDRDTFLREAWESAQLTIPYLIPENIDARNQRTHRGLVIKKPWQSIGARGVNNLSAKLLLALLPPTGSFFRYEVDNSYLLALPPDVVDAVKTDLEQRLAARERIIMSEVNGPIRTKSFLGLKHLIVAGNVLMYLPPEGGARVFPLNSYVVRRDFLGNVLEFVYVEILDYDTVSPKVREMVDAEKKFDTEEDRHRNKPVEVYTHAMREGKRLKFRQEVCGQTVPGSQGNVKVEDSPWLVLRWTAIDGEDYGRGFVEEYRGDLRSSEELSNALTKAALNAAKLIPLISPQSTITARRLVNAENGEPLVANPDDVVFLQQAKQADMQVARVTKQDIEAALAGDFLMNASFQRKGERVTAEEIRTMAQELEDTLGGVYSVQSQEFQLPLARRIEANLVRRGTLERIEDGVNLTVVTGLAAIGRGQDLQRLREAIAMVGEVAPLFPEVAKRVNAGDLIKRIFIGVGVDVNGLLLTDKQFQAVMEQEAQNAQRMAMLDLAKSGTGAAALQGVQAATQSQQAEQPQ